jgi:hypothetical protein
MRPAMHAYARVMHRLTQALRGRLCIYVQMFWVADLLLRERLVKGHKGAVIYFSNAG